MDLQNLRSKLFERKLEIMEYFGVGFSAFKVLLKENKFLMFFSFLLTFFFVILKITVQLLKVTLRAEEWDRNILAAFIMMSILSLLFNAGLTFFNGYFLRKVAFKLENNKNDLKLFEIFIKVLVFLGISLVLGILLSFVDDQVMAIFNFSMMIVVIWALLYSEVYYIRGFGLGKSIKYSLELSKGNRLRVIVPVIFATITIVLEIIFSIFILKDELEPFSFLSIFVFFVFVLFTTLIIMYMGVLNVVIFLNVENDYFKNEGRNSEFNLRNNQEITEISNDNFEKKEDSLE